MNKNELNNLVFYEIYPTSFFDSNSDGIGDLKGITQKLEYVRDLGCNGIWLNPFYVSPFKDGGYDIADFFAVDPRFGTNKDFCDLVERAHQLGIKVIVDLVAGHSSSANPDFIKSGEPERNENWDLFIWTHNVWNNNGKYRLISGMHQRNGCYMVNFFAHQPAFNYGFNKIDEDWQMSYKDDRTLQAREYMLKVMRFWLGLGADGFRVDMADSLVKNDDDKTATIEVWTWMFDRIRAEFPQAFFVSEWSNPQQALRAGFDADFVLDHWDNFFHRLVRSRENTRGKAALNGGDLQEMLKDLKYRLAAADKYGGRLALISGNHDTDRISGFLDEDRLRIYYMFMFFLPAVPFIYYGDEIMMKTAPLLSKDGGYQRTGSRTPMMWDESANKGFSKADPDSLYLPLNYCDDTSVEKQKNNPDSIYHFIKKCIEVRKLYSDIDDCQVEENDRVITISRGNYQLIMNLSDKIIKSEGEQLVSSTKEKDLVPYSAKLIRK